MVQERGKAMAGVMTFKELVADRKRHITVRPKYAQSAEGMSRFMEISFGKYKVLITSANFKIADKHCLVFSDEGHLLRDIKESVIREAFEQVVVEVAKSELGIDYKPGKSVFCIDYNPREGGRG